ncbi:MAG: acyl-CoA dehydrogenase domain-containing protein, partial [Acidobacteriota bacterium]
FDGVSEPLARIAGRAYLLEAARVFTCGALASGHRPAVISAMMKYNATELARRSALDGMDVVGGAAICLGPRNLMARAYRSTPIGITVEGANILTRTLIVFGQGAIRCHPHAHALLESIRSGDRKAFRRAFLGQQGHILANLIRGVVRGLSRGLLIRSPLPGPVARHVRRLAWASTRFANAADLAMVAVGGRLKTRGRLTGRFADILSWLFLITATLRRYEAEGRREDDLPVVHWICEEGFWQIQQAFDGIYQNLDAPLASWWTRTVGSWWHRAFSIGRPPSDALSRSVAETIQQAGEQRDRMTPHLHIADGSPWADLEAAFHSATEAEPALAKIQAAIKRRELPKAPPETLLDPAVEAGLITSDERALIERAVAARADAIRVDDFTLDELRGVAGAFDPVADAAGG